MELGASYFILKSLWFKNAIIKQIKQAKINSRFLKDHSFRTREDSWIDRKPVKEIIITNMIHEIGSGSYQSCQYLRDSIMMAAQIWIFLNSITKQLTVNRTEVWYDTKQVERAIRHAISCLGREIWTRSMHCLAIRFMQKRKTYEFRVYCIDRG